MNQEIGMRERIQELAYKAEELADAEVDIGSEFHPEFCRIFAELLIEETRKVCSENMGYSEYIAMRDRVKNHFGLE